MELSNKFLDATWTKDINGKPKFFIINEAIIAKLCVLGNEEEPCFEGATITQPQIQFSFDNDFKNQLFSMMDELKQLIKEGGAPVFTTFAVEIGDALWQALYSFLETKFPRDLKDGECEDCYRCSKYYIDSIWEEGTQKFAIIKERENGKLYRMNFSYSEEGLNSDGAMVEVEKSYVPVTEEPTFSLEAIEAYEAERYKVADNSEQTENNETETTLEDNTEFAKKKEEEGKEGNKDEKEDGEEKCPKCGKPKSECTCEEDDTEEEDEKKKKKFSLEEIPEYVALQSQYSALETEFNALKETNANLEAQVADLVAFKNEVDKKDKQAMIDSFYMLSDEDKADVINNIDTYSIDDIEAKLAIICVRNKVNFNLDDDNNDIQEPTTYSLNDGGETDYTPAWIKSLQSVAKDIK